jgi:hypothetical protein
MKKQLLILIFIYCGITLANASGNYPADRLSDNLIIDTGDTVVFDLLHATVNGGYVQFPVYFKSDDIINAVDFSFKYNQLDFVYDSISNLTNYLQPLSYYNAVDSTVRFTSYSIQNITHDTALVSVRFNVLTGDFCSNDINTVTGYLNGDLCSVKVIECLSTGISNLAAPSDAIDVFPNPANDILTVEAPVKSVIEIFDLSGKMIKAEQMDNDRKEINVKSLREGVYILKAYTEQFVSVKRIIISH